MTSAPPPAPPSVEPPAWQPPPPIGPQPGPRLHRSRTDKMIGGVAGGLAEYSGVDPLLWRVGFVALAFAGGSGILVYLLLWLLMPTDPPGLAGEGQREERAPRPPAGPRSPVPGVTIAALLIVVGVLALLANVTAWNPGPRAFLGGALLVVGLGLVVAAFSGGRRARGGLIALGVVLSLALIAVSTLPWAGGRDVFRGGVGDRDFRPATAAEVRPDYRGGVGDMTVDLTQVDVSNLRGPIRTRIEHGVGDLRVRVPQDADVQVNVSHGLGNVDLMGHAATAASVPGTGSGSWVGDGTPEIVLTINAGIGDVEVSRG